MLIGIGAFIYVMMKPEAGSAKRGDAVQGNAVDPLTLWFESVAAPPGSWEAREQAADWMVRNAADRQALAFGFNMLRGWLDLDVRGADARAVEKLIRELDPLFRD